MQSILISNPVWGKKNCKIFCNYSLKSLLFKNNIPLLLKEKFKITLHILTKKEDLEIFRKNIFFKKIPKSVIIKFFFFSEKFLFFGKYSKVTRLQNISIKESSNHDYLIFNYADFVWSDGALFNTVRKIIDNKVDFLSFFCLPVNHKELKQFVKSKNSINPRQLSAFCVNNLHRETKLRFWSDKTFTVTPTFIIFEGGIDSLLVSAYHQTILIADTRNENKTLMEGIKGVTLDEYFSSVLDKEKYLVVNNSDQIMVSAICDWSHNSAIPRNYTRDKSIKNCFRRLNQSNRDLSEKIITISGDHKNDKVIKGKLLNAKKTITEINNKYPFNKILHFLLTNKYSAQIFQFLFIYIFPIFRRVLHFFLTVLYELFMVYGRSIDWLIYCFNYVILQKNKNKRFKSPNFKRIINSYKISLIRVLTLK